MYFQFSVSLAFNAGFQEDLDDSILACIRWKDVRCSRFGVGGWGGITMCEVVHSVRAEQDCKAGQVNALQSNVCK